MKITSIYREKQYNDNGLSNIEIYNLSSIVLLVGENGAGKTRFLKQLIYTVKNKNIIINDYNSAENSYKLSQDKTRGGTITGAFSMSINPSEVSFFRNKADKLKKEIEDKYSFEIEFEDEEEHTIKVYDIFPKGTEQPKIIKNAEIQEIEKAFDAVYKENSIEIIYENTLLILYHIYNEYLKSKVKEYSMTEEMRTYYEKKYLEINDLLDKYLNTTYKVKNDKICFYEDQDFDKLSLGQRIIILCTILFVFYKNTIDKSIFIIDEPETHLHPKIVFDLFEELNKIVGQIWIATHNISIISYFQDYTKIFLKNGIIRNNGNIKSEVLATLFGNDTTKLLTFIEEPFKQGILDFCFQCLFEPKIKNIKEIKNTDPQLLQIKEYINDILKKKEKDKLTIMDYGSGDGRLLSFIRSESEKDKVNDRINYVAFDKEENIKCKKIISEIYANVDEHYYTKGNNLESLAGKIDIVIMLNVLHEISPKEWEETFIECNKLLAGNGIVLLIENVEIKTGENAHEYNFIVLENNAVRKLFNINDLENESIYKVSDCIKINIDVRVLERIQANIIKKEILQNINNKTIKTTLEWTKENARNNIEMIKTQDKDRYNGKLFSFYLLQYASCEMALEDLFKNKK